MLREIISRKEDMELKLKNVRGFLEVEHYDFVYYQRQDNFAWLTSGGHNGIPYNSEYGECVLLVTKEVVYLITNSIEKPRIVNEEIASLPIQVVEYPWYNSAFSEIEKIVKKGRIASDTFIDGMDFRGDDLSKLRYSLTKLEVARYKYLGEIATTLLEQYCHHITPGQTELEIAAGLNKRYLANGLLPTVTLVACDERIDLFRHPIATKKQFKKKCMVVSCVSYKGLIVALTRMIFVDKLSQALNDKFTLTAQVDAEVITASIVGTSTDQIFTKIKELYEAAGYSGEWQYHHQGGAIGYQNRDYLITPTMKNVIVENQAFAWNPSIKGTKSEDTIIVGVSKPEIITISLNNNWPQLNIKVSNGETIKRPAILQI